MGHSLLSLPIFFMNKHQSNSVDLLTGLVGEIDDLEISKREISGSFDMLDMFKGDFEITTNKKGKMKEIALSMEYEYEEDEFLRVEVEWDGIKQKKFDKAIRGKYEDAFNKSIDLLAQQDISGFIDEFESIPGVGDLSAEAWGNGLNISWN